MPTPAKGARLWLKRAYGSRKGAWYIKDGDRRIALGRGAHEREEAERDLADYLAAKYRPERGGARDPQAVAIADVVNIYATDVGPSVKQPKELAQRLEAILDFFGEQRLAEVTAQSCRAYAARRGSDSMARRELEDLRAAINHAHAEGVISAPVRVTLPPRSSPRERWLTRSEAARLLWAAWRYREVQKGKPTDRRSRQHVARFILVGLYTGTRSAAICAASFQPAIGRGHVDLDRGVFYRRPAGVSETKKRQPAAMLPPRLLAHMRRWADKGIAARAVVEFEGRPVKSVRKAFSRAARAAGLEGVSPHVLRHTAASWAMQGGANVYATADFLGMTVETLQRVYGHLRPDHHAGVVKAMTGKR
jgi:integrase